jgi:ribosome biogenesis protein Tsr3
MIKLKYEILVDHGETSNKCTIMPLSYRSDFVIRRFPRGQPIPAFKARWLLHPDGIPLNQVTSADASDIGGIGAVDCVWRRLEPICKWLDKPLPTLIRIPEGFVTAYPRQSKKDFDPEGGFATIEALFIGAAFLGDWDESILCEYFFADRFLQLNEEAFRHWGIDSSRQSLGALYQPRTPRSAHKRRIGRGRISSEI